MKEIQKPNIVAVFEHYSLRILAPDRGGWRKAECPRLEHEDSNPSASLNEDSGSWWCHACAEGGDGLDIIMEREDFGGFNAARTYAERLFGGDVVDTHSEPRSSLLPRGSGSHRGRPKWKAPWTSL